MLGSQEGKLLLLVNPCAGRGRAGRLLPRITGWLKEKRVAFDCRFSEGPGHLTELSRSCIRSGSDYVIPVVCGGDGSFNEVINGLPPSAPPVGIIPGGSGDDISRNLGIPSSIEGACRNILNGGIRTIDVVSTGGRVYAGIGGAGIDSDVTRRAVTIRLPIPGRAVYTWAVLATLASFRPRRFTITADGWQYRGRVMFVGVANARSYGGGLKLSPASRMNDGLMEVCIVGEMGRLELLRSFPRLFRGTHLSHPRVRLLNARRLHMDSDTPVDFFADGEYHQRLPVDLEVRPAALRVIAPATESP